MPVSRPLTMAWARLRRKSAVIRSCLPSFAGEVARRAGGVMGNGADAHDPSPRFAGTSPRVARGGRLRQVRRLSFQPGIGNTNYAVHDSSGRNTVLLRMRLSM